MLHFLQGLQPTKSHEYKFWNARRLVFIQCSVTGTPLSWYVRLNDIYKQDWSAFVQAFKKQIFSQMNAYYARVEALMCTQPRDPNNKHKPAYENIVYPGVEQTTPILLVSKINKMMTIKETPMLDLNLLENLLYNTFVLLLVRITLTEQITNLQNLMIDTVVEVHHVIVIQIAILDHKIDVVLTLETDTDITELLLLHNLIDQEMTRIAEIHLRIVQHTDGLSFHLIGEIHVLDIDHIHTLEIDHFHKKLRDINFLPNPKSLDLVDLDQVLKQQIKSIPFIQSNQVHLLTLKSTCTIPKKWLQHLHLQVGFTLYTYILLKDTMITIILQD